MELQAGEISNKVHDFGERLAYSVKAGHESFWQAVYQEAFPDMVFAEPCTGKCQGQYLGIDRVIQLKSGRTLYVDEKKREKDRGDILLEYVSVDTTGAPGWIEKDLLIDYLAYAFMPSKICYVLPWQPLRRAWVHLKGEWIRKYKIPPARNNGYNTLSVAVPIKELLHTIKCAMIIHVSRVEEAAKSENEATQDEIIF